MRPVRVGFVGVGAISGIYLENLTHTFDNLEVYAVCDLVREKAEAAQKKYRVPKLYDTMQQLFADPEVDIVLNITRPYEHYGVTRAALEAGKPVYSEKPLAATLAEGRELVELAARKGLLLGGAPDTFLGGGIATCKALIKEGVLGRPVGAAAAMLCRGHESWHPDPAFYYQHGGGPMMDMGPYYVTALVELLGDVETTLSTAAATFATRTITSKPHAGEVIKVEVPTHVNGILNFACGASGTLTTSFDVVYPSQARLEIYGSEGTLFVPDPNTFGGPVKLQRLGESEVREIPLRFGFTENSRGYGLSQMAEVLRGQRGSFPCSCTRTLHVLEVLEALNAGGEHVIRSRQSR